jgi:hypothetical protein
VFSPVFGPVRISKATGADTEATVETPVIVAVNDTQAICMWVDYGGNNTDYQVVGACVVTVVGTSVTVSETVDLWGSITGLPASKADDYVITFSNIPVACNGYVVALVANTLVWDSGVDDSLMVIIGIQNGLPVVVNQYDLWDIFPWSSGLYTDSGSKYTELAYNTTMVSQGTEIVAFSGYRSYPSTWSWKLIKIFVDNSGDVSVVDMGTPSFGSAFAHAAAPMEPGYSVFNSSTDVPDYLTVVYSALGSSTYSVVANGELSGHYAKQDQQTTPYIDSLKRYTIDGANITQTYDWNDSLPAPYEFWAEYSNSQVLSVLHDASGNVCIFGSTQDATFNDYDAGVLDTSDNTFFDFGTMSALFAGQSLGYEFGYFGYITAERVGGIFLVALTAGSEFSLLQESTTDPYQSLYLLGTANYPVPNLEGEFEDDRRQFWRHTPY